MSPTAVVVILVAGGAIAVAGWWAYHATVPPPTGTSSQLATSARLFGLVGGYLGAVQLLLAARLPWFENSVPVGQARALHAGTGSVFLALALGHAALAVAAEGAASEASFVGALIGVTAHFPYVWLAVLGLTLLLVAGIVSARPVRRLLRYGWWHLVHLGVYPGIAASFVHQLYGVDLVSTPARALWTGLHVVALAAVGWFRVLAPLRLTVRHQFRVAAVVVETPGVVSVQVSGRRLDELGAMPGQYFRWRVLTRPLWLRSHPFSLSAAPAPDRLRFTVKAVGDYTDAVLGLAPGARLLASGPYGAMTERARRGRRVLLVAGGVGIAPLRALLEGVDAGPGEVTLLYRTDRADQVIFRAEIDDLAERRGVVVHYRYSRPPAEGETEADPFGPHGLVALVPNLFDHDAYVCGSPTMVDAVVRSLRRAGVERRRIHTENFVF